MIAFLKILRNFTKCTFCNRKNCSKRYRLRDEEFFLSAGFLKYDGCPKDIQKNLDKTLYAKIK